MKNQVKFWSLVICAYWIFCLFQSPNCVFLDHFSHCNMNMTTDYFCDAAAMLTVDDDEFWVGVSPVEFGSLPALQDAVTVVGYPIGGDTISVTSGVVSRIEILSYVHGSAELLGLQVSKCIRRLIMSCLPDQRCF